MVEVQDSSVPQFYENRSVFITGATGFVGKVLLEKLLRSCPGLRNVYVLMREKKGKSTNMRCEELSRSNVFDVLKNEHPEAIGKIIVVTGDILLPGLGISEPDLTTITENVSIIFHVAATVKFEEPLKKAIDINVLGTRRILELCRRLKKLEALIHISTAYSNCDRYEIEEIVYPPPMPVEKVIGMTKWLDSNSLDIITQNVIGNHPNTYTFTKAMAENLLAEEGEKLPIAIIRPSVISASWKEPIPGWVDSFNGSTGVIVAIAKGILRTFMGHGELVADIIPVDVVVNVMISAAWHTAVHRPNKITVYHCTSGSMNKTTWSEVLRCSNQCALKYPSAKVFRYPHTEFRRTPVSNKVHAVFQHYLIAFLYDIFARIFHGKPRMVTLYQKIHKATDCLHYFSTHEWKFHCDNVLTLHNLLSEQDKVKFFSDLKPLNWECFWENHALGFRKFLLKEDPSTIPVARKNLKRLYILFQVAKLIVVIGISAFFFSRVVL